MMNHDNLLLDNQLCFALYSATNAVVRTYQKKLADLNLTYPQYLVMLALWDLEQAPVREVADRLNIDSGTLTPILKRMETAGLVVRERDKADERRVLIRMTPVALRMREKLAPLQAEVACGTGLSRREFTTLRDTLHRLARSISTRQSRRGSNAA